jgi:HEAT repeat protein
MAVPDSPSPAGLNPEEIRQAILSGDASRAMPALVSLRQLQAEQAVPLLLLGLEQEPFIVRSLSCAGLGLKRNEAGWEALATALKGDGDANVRAEAANALASYGVERAWPLLREAFARDDQWLVRCSVLSALAEDPAMPPSWLLELAEMAIADSDGTVRVGGAEVLGRLVREAAVTGGETPQPPEVRASLVALQADPDHRVAAAALNGLQG